MEAVVVRVFVGEEGGGGNPLAVLRDARSLRPAARQEAARRLGYSETVFIDDEREGRLTINTPTTDLPFAGHPLVGTGWLLGEWGHHEGTLRPPAGEVPYWREGERVWIRARASWVTPSVLVQLDSPKKVDALTSAPSPHEESYMWAWIDEAAGIIRSRFFAPGVGVPEDEATGSLAVRITAELGRPLVIRQGTGSELLTRFDGHDLASVGGRVRPMGRREIDPG